MHLSRNADRLNAETGGGASLPLGGWVGQSGASLSANFWKT